MKSSQGLLIVLDGIDGSGKTTQINLLSQYLKATGIDFEIISFPRYGNNQYTDQIENYLKGNISFDPHSIAKAYAGDRLLAKPQIEQWLNEGKLVISNRYTSANKAHLNVDLEENMPKPDLTILLDVDPKIGQDNVLTHNRPDIHEHDLNHLERARKIYLEISKSEANWVVVNCMNDGKMKEKAQIQQEIIKILKEKLGVN